MKQNICKCQLNDARERKHMFLMSPRQAVYHDQLMSKINRHITSFHLEFGCILCQDHAKLGIL